jgi:site-specific DNA recombinase
VQRHEQGIDIHWRDDGWIGLGPDIAEHALVEDAGDMQEEVLA